MIFVFSKYNHKGHGEEFYLHGSKKIGYPLPLCTLYRPLISSMGGFFDDTGLFSAASVVSGIESLAKTPYTTKMSWGVLCKHSLTPVRVTM
jgi:hypothetical protein